MSSPVTAGAVIVTSLLSARAEQKAGEAQAQAAELDKAQEELALQQRIENRRRRFFEVIGSQTAEFAAGGVRTDVGTPEAIRQADADELRQSNITDILETGIRTDQLTLVGRNALSAARLAALTRLTAGVARVSDVFGSEGRTG